MPKPISRLPQSDWIFHEIHDAASLDLEEAPQCDFCGRRLRWIHVLEHDDHPNLVATGCCCAARLCSGYDAEAAEREFKNQVERRMRFIDPQRWKRSGKNPQNIWRTVMVPNGRVMVTVFLKDGRYGVCLDATLKRRKQKPRFSSGRVDSQAEAKHMAFEAIDAMKQAAGQASPSSGETT